jgi:hypothetical protein
MKLTEDQKEMLDENLIDLIIDQSQEMVYYMDLWEQSEDVLRAIRQQLEVFVGDETQFFDTVNRGSRASTTVINSMIRTRELPPRQVQALLRFLRQPAYRYVLTLSQLANRLESLAARYNA